MRAELFFRSMGSDAHVIVESDEDDETDRHDAITGVRELLEDLEQRWSRFLPSSELSAINDLAPSPVRVSTRTLDVIRLAVEGWQLTAGRFDPSVGTAVVGNGYTRSFWEMSGESQVTATLVVPASGCSNVVIDDDTSTVSVPAGTQLDLGGIGKGRAADLAIALLAAAGVGVACVNVGGDARVIGGEHIDGGWAIAVEDPFDDRRSLTTLALVEGAVVTSARTRRRWATRDGERHHLVDPSTGASARSGLAQVTVLAAEGAWAEILGKAAFVAGADEGAALVESSGAAGLFVTDAGDVVRCGGIERFER